MGRTCPDDLLWDTFDVAWERIEQRASIRGTHLAVPLLGAAAEPSELAELDDVVRFGVLPRPSADTDADADTLLCCGFADGAAISIRDTDTGTDLASRTSLKVGGASALVRRSTFCLLQPPALTIPSPTRGPVI